jgi:hypothetical protein
VRKPLIILSIAHHAVIEQRAIADDGSREGFGTVAARTRR